jgi:HSP20 family protein
MNSLTTWNPLRALDDLSHRFARIFGDLPLGLRPPATDSTGDGRDGPTLAAWSPAVDISENGKSYTIKADMPEVKKEDVKVTVKNGVLELSGERKSETEEKDEKHHRIERSYGRFLRTFTLPEDADAAGIHAKCKEGVLTVTLPKSKDAKAKELAVKVE